ncbi:hypothetical protein FNV43_RR07427 [Rhamnella rubrinervis]|uniref:Uncharacterized protein n=1 Tax=Rhamnella rubrinervis TaxID=2594499 RepID=A0A8K0HEY0_9ROSA|nr:hypothetical protein FNV43_RR07427 [Rhamnella rubrinervis]
MASRGPRIAIVVPLLLLLFATICGSSHGVPGSVSSSYKHRSLMAVQGRHANRIPNQIPNCNDLLLEPQCSQSPKCRWCRSDALDDMCFAKVEAWRLPSQCRWISLRIVVKVVQTRGCGYKVKSLALSIQRKFEEL